MTQSWKALPIPNDPDGALLKAPTMKDHRLQQEFGWKPPREVEQELPLARALAKALQFIRMPLSKTDVREGHRTGGFLTYRYPEGINVKMPSAWILVMPMPSQTLKATLKRGGKTAP